MSRIARISLPGLVYHVTQRGNARQRVFFDDTDYLLYGDLLRDHAAKAGLAIWAYCLMPNHVHLIAAPGRPTSMARGLGRTHAEYARHFNLRQRTCGHVWQARFFSCPLDGPHLWRAMAYVERNPVRARMAERAGQYQWSSAAAHLADADTHAMLDLSVWRREYGAERWARVLESSVGEEAFGLRMQEASLRGRPLGAGDFVNELESQAGRRLRPLPVGRPKQVRDEGSDQLTFANGV